MFFLFKKKEIWPERMKKKQRKENKKQKAELRRTSTHKTRTEIRLKQVEIDYFAEQLK